MAQTKLLFAPVDLAGFRFFEQPVFARDDMRGYWTLKQSTYMLCYLAEIHESAVRGGYNPQDNISNWN